MQGYMTLLEKVSDDSIGSDCAVPSAVLPKREQKDSAM